ncbi:MAG: HNH endonuclease [Victivallaceae bacterium]|nr:HNH endonuclease [Victivallaceae bacterium]
MDEWIEINRDEKHTAREKKRAKKLRQSPWWRQQLERGICHYCGNHFAPEELTMDHLVPIVRGGRSTKGNVVPCCKPCNNAKKYLTPAEIIMEADRNKLK